MNVSSRNTLRQRAIQNLEEQWEDLTFENDFVFGAVLRSDLDLCRRFLEVVLETKIDHVELVETQRVIAPAPDAKSVRLDVYVADGRGTVYDIEMQRTNASFLAKRARYYQSLLDAEQLDKGAEYNELPNTYVIFFCTFDPFRRGYRKYTFKQGCEEDPSVKALDGATRIFLNAFGERGQVTDELANLLRYIGGVYHSDEGLVGDIEAAVRKVLSSEDLRRQFVMLELKLSADRMMARYEGREEGRAEGRKEGRAEVMSRLADLRNALEREGRIDELLAALGNPEDLDRLYAEFGLDDNADAPA